MSSCTLSGDPRIYLASAAANPSPDSTYFAPGRLAQGILRERVLWPELPARGYSEYGFKDTDILSR